MRPTFEIADGAWEVTSAGALRCRARVLAVGVMAYSDGWPASTGVSGKSLRPLAP